MVRDKAPYYKVRKGRGFFQLGKKRARKAGMNSSIPLGADSKKTRATAWVYYHEWLEKSGLGDVMPDDEEYPKGSLGAFWDAYRYTKAWEKKKLTTQTEWSNCWKYIRPFFGDRGIKDISPAEFAEFQEHLQETKGDNIRWRVVKVSRALFNAAVNNFVIEASPAKSLPNPRPAPRYQIWRAAEIGILVKAANELNKPAMALAIRIGWETAMQPIDVRTLTLSERLSDAKGAWFDTSRSKTKRSIVAAISDELSRDIDAYVASLGVTVLPDQPFLRTSRDAHEYKKARFLTDFRIVREKAFGKQEKRRFQDIRRSANVEADLGAATPEERADLLANALDKDPSLDATYTPKTVEKSRQIAEKRLVGRRHLAINVAKEK